MASRSSRNGGGGGSNACSFEVAIVGGGIVGVMTALGLLRRGIKAVIYERAGSWHEISAGFAFTAVARECMQQMDPAILEVLSRIGQKTDSSASTGYWNAYHPQTKRDTEDESKSLLFKTVDNHLSFWGCVRSQFLLGMAALLPDGVAKFGKQLVSYDDDGVNEKVVLHFADGSTAEAHAVLGCDGIHSVTRRLILGADHPAARPSYTHTVAYRTMVPMSDAVLALGDEKAKLACMHCGPNANIMSYPVMNATFLNIAAFVYEAPEFPDPDTMTAPATRGELEQVLSRWGPHMRDLAKLFPEHMIKWGIFDTDDHPASTYARGRVCIVGDAAHASTPFQGVGACMGVEDALVVCEVLDVARDRIGRDGSGQIDGRKTSPIEKALQVYSRERMNRSQWVVRSSREMGEMYQWRYGPTGRDAKRSRMKLEQASRRIWDFDVGDMVTQSRAAAAET